MINNEIFGSYILCKYKSFLKYFGKVGTISEYEEFQRQREIEYKMKVNMELFKKWNKKPLSKNSFVNNANLQSGKELFSRITINNKDIMAHVDILEKVTGKSASGSFTYIPYMIVPKTKISKQDKLLLAFMGYALEKEKMRAVASGRMLYDKPLKSSKIDLTKYYHTVDAIIEKIREFSDKNKKPTLRLHKHCSACEFQEDCEKQVRDKDDLSLLRGIKEKEIETQNNKGIFTVNQLSYTFRSRKPSRRAKTHSNPHYFALQALSLRENTIYIHGDPKLPTAETRIFFDIEGLPYRDFYYLIGVIIVSGNKTTHCIHWADREQDQSQIFSEFVNELSRIPNAIFYHYGAYETKALKRMKKNLDKEFGEFIETILANSVNVLSIVHSHIYFPVYSNSLKNIGTVLGHQWRHVNDSGIQSIVWREMWERNKDQELKSKLIEYNKNDCLALKRVFDFLARITSSKKSNIQNGGNFSKIINTNELKQPLSNRPIWGDPNFVLDDFNQINRCAHFDYQREKIFVRINKKFRGIKKRQNKMIRLSSRPNKQIEIVNTQCPQCGSKILKKGSMLKKRIFDLNFHKGGVKKWILHYVSWRYKCLECNTGFVPKEYPKGHPIFGHGIMSWCVYQGIARNQALLQVYYSLGDIFQLCVGQTSVYKSKSIIAKFYESTYNRILEDILKGPILHIDETTIKLRSKKGYVWVIANMDRVYYFYQESRETFFLKKMLKNFSGVLISDFYTGYDTFDCPQQKCLIHLIRDLNDDLLRNPFDEGFKMIVRRFTKLLRIIIETVDKYGLKNRNLRKHKKDTQCFFTFIASEEFSSEVAKKYQKRFRKNEKKLFTFLDYDGVPWNNNNAEHAIHTFAKYRESSRNVMTEQSLKEDLVILSIFQSCEYNNIKVLNFLLSKETNIENHLDSMKSKSKTTKD